MSEVVPVALPTSLRDAVTRLAARDGISLEQWITIALAQKVAVAETAESFLKREAARAAGRPLSEILAGTPDAPPVPGDELPDDPREAPNRP